MNKVSLGPLLGGIILSLSNGFVFGIVLSALSIIPFIISFQVLKFGFDNRKMQKTQIPRTTDIKVKV